MVFQGGDDGRGYRNMCKMPQGFTLKDGHWCIYWPIMVLGIPPHSHSYFPLSRSLILIPLPSTPLTLIPLYYVQARYSSVAAPGSLAYQQGLLWGNGECLRDPGPHTRAMSQWPNFLNFIYGFCIRRQLPKKPTSTFFFIGVFTDFEMSISGGSAKRLWYLFFGACCLVFFFSKKYFSPRKILG
jgi:hypothetical protein